MQGILVQEFFSSSWNTSWICNVCTVIAVIPEYVFFSDFRDKCFFCCKWPSDIPWNWRGRNLRPFRCMCLMPCSVIPVLREVEWLRMKKDSLSQDSHTVHRCLIHVWLLVETYFKSYWKCSMGEVQGWGKDSSCDASTTFPTKLTYWQCGLAPLKNSKAQKLKHYHFHWWSKLFNLTGVLWNQADMVTSVITGNRGEHWTRHFVYQSIPNEPWSVFQSSRGRRWKR